MGDVLVVNASPLIFLGKAGRLELLRSIGASRVVVPERVHREVTAAPSKDSALHALAETHWIEQCEDPPIPLQIAEWDLGPGESCVIATALSMQEATVIIDDLAGRRCALAFDIALRGTLGIVLEAHRRAVIHDPRAVILELRAHGMWLSDAVIDKALRLAGVTP